MTKAKKVAYKRKLPLCRLIMKSALEGIELATKVAVTNIYTKKQNNSSVKPNIIQSSEKYFEK